MTKLHLKVTDIKSINRIANIKGNRSMRKQTSIWTTKAGERIRICDMTDRHLINTIKYLKRITEKVLRSSIYTGYQMLGSLQGEMAIDCVESELSHLEEEGLAPSDLCPLYDNLQDEKTRRGI